MNVKILILCLFVVSVQAFIVTKNPPLLHPDSIECKFVPDITNSCNNDKAVQNNDDVVSISTSLSINPLESVPKKITNTLTSTSRQNEDAGSRKKPLSVKNLLGYFSGNYALNSFQKDRVASLWKSLKNRGTIRHLDDFDNAKLKEALKICFVAFWDSSTINKSLKVATDHSCGMASILGEMKAPVDVILSGLICDVVAVLDSVKNPRYQMNINFITEELSKRFGADVIDLARDYNQLPIFSVKSTQYSISQAQTQMEMLISLMGNYYCLHLRLADRIYVLRELKNLLMTDIERVKVAQEARHVYAPLAHKMNLAKVKNELEDLSLRYLEPGTFMQCRMAQILASKLYQETFEKIKSLVSQDTLLSPHKDRIKVSYRIKGKYQLFQKMIRKNISSPLLIRDALGIRVVVNPSLRKESITDIELCYQLLSRICNNLTNWQPINATLKDYIAFPKENGYQSLHQCIRRKGTNASIELQIRTKEMHIQAEVGAAAHWSYKDFIFRPNIASSKLYRATWRAPAQLQAHSAMEVIRCAQLFLQNNRVFVFLEDQSEVLNLKRSATALDAAFMIHSQIGLKVDRILVDKGEKEIARNALLEDGQVLSVKTSDRLSILKQIEALSIVKTSHARQALRRYLKTEYPEAAVCLGIAHLMLVIENNRDLVEERIKRYGILSNSSAVFFSEMSAINSSFEQKYIDMVLHFQQLVQLRLGKALDIFLQEIGLMHETDELQKVFSSLLDVPACRLVGITSLDFALIWIRRCMSDDSFRRENDNACNDTSISRGNNFLHQILKFIINIILPSYGYSSSAVWNMWNQILRDGSHDNRKDISLSTNEISSVGKLKFIAQVMRQIRNVKS